VDQKELLATIGEQEVQLRRLRIEISELQARYSELQQFVFSAAKDGRPIVLVETPATEEQAAA
jgi:hypothetical protein